GRSYRRRSRSRRSRFGSRRRFDFRHLGNRFGSTTAASYRTAVRWRRGFRFGLGRGRSSRSPAATTCRRRWRSDARSFLTLPTSAYARDLIVAQRTEMAADGDIHLAQEADHLVAGNPELACQIMYSKLAQPTSSSRTSTNGSRLSARMPFAKPL